MVNFNAPVVAATVARAYATLALAMDGLYTWEFFINLGYEWSIIKGRRPYRWTIWIYSTVRLTTLMGVIIEFATSIIAIPTNCKVWTKFQFGFGYMTFSLSSLLIILRIIAIWNKNKFVVAFAVAVWLTTTSFFIHGTTQIRSEWVPDNLACGEPNTESNKLAITAMPVTDIALLLIMLIGLLRIRYRGGGKFNLGRLLWKQGVIYLFVATIAEIPPAVFILLDLNPVSNLMFLIPSLITMSIAATRMYRSLADFVHDNDMYGTVWFHYLRN
ncbi:hypothetical protein BC827DRAFT_903995 [Russula dissimulans]|nr:hypothetical protein BC827DRAFT_903995 [Russula dissimulans]